LEHLHKKLIYLLNYSIKFFYIIDKSYINIDNSTNYYNKNLSSTLNQSKRTWNGLAKTDISYSYVSEDNFKFGNVYIENFKFNLVTSLNYQNDFILKPEV